MRNREGTPIWYELLTDDPDAARDFYGGVVGWTFTSPPGGLERDYHIFSTSDASVGGLMKIPDGAQISPQWLGHIGVNEFGGRSIMVGIATL